MVYLRPKSKPNKTPTLESHALSVALHTALFAGSIFGTIGMAFMLGYKQHVHGTKRLGFLQGQVYCVSRWPHWYCLLPHLFLFSREKESFVERQ